ncbi:MAG: hypothetical protein JXB04_01925 [Kiritimatiellae bacterium]|nr:hypothetical protein [Kiritimatiellia bacterium]
MRRSVAVVLAVLVTACAVQAQTEPPSSNVPGEPFSWLLYAYEDEADFDAAEFGGGKASIHELDFLGTPLYQRAGPWQRAIGLLFRWNGFDFDAVDLDDLDLYTLGLSLDLIRTEGPWTLWANATPSLFTDFERLTDDDFHALLGGMATYAWRPNVQWALGASYDREFGEDKLYPMAGAIWRPAREWEFNLVLPMPRITWAPTSKFLLFADARPAGGLWNISDDETDEEFDFKLEGYRLGLGAEYELAPHIWLHAAAGTSIERNYEISSGHTELLKSDADDTYFARAGIVVR